MYQLAETAGSYCHEAVDYGENGCLTGYRPTPGTSLRRRRREWSEKSPVAFLGRRRRLGRLRGVLVARRFSAGVPQVDVESLDLVREDQDRLTRGAQLRAAVALGKRCTPAHECREFVLVHRASDSLTSEAGRIRFFSNARLRGPHWRTDRRLEIGD